MGLVNRLGSLFRRSPSEAERAVGDSPEVIAAELVDHLVIHRPTPWTQITIRCEQQRDGLRVVSYDLITPGSDAPDAHDAPRYLLDDNGMRTAFVSVAIERLADALSLSDDAREWSGEHLECRRVGDRFVVNAIDDAGGIVAALPALRDRDRLLSPRHIEDLRGLRDTIEAADAELHRAISGHVGVRWEAERHPDRVELSFAGGRTLAMHAAFLGSHSQDTQAWTWGWADPIRSRASARAKTLRERGRGIFGRPEFQSSEPFAWTVAHLASARLGAPAYCWHDAETGVSLFFSLLGVAL